MTQVIRENWGGQAVSLETRVPMRQPMREARMTLTGINHLAKMGAATRLLQTVF